MGYSAAGACRAIEVEKQVVVRERVEVRRRAVGGAAHLSTDIRKEVSKVQVDSPAETSPSYSGEADDHGSSGPSWQDRRVEALEFDASVGGGEAPVDGRTGRRCGRASRRWFPDQRGFVGNAAVQALAGSAHSVRSRPCSANCRAWACSGSPACRPAACASVGSNASYSEPGVWVFRLSITSTICSASG